MHQQNPPIEMRPVTVAQPFLLPQRRLIAYGIIAASVVLSAIVGQLDSPYRGLDGPLWVVSILLLGMIAALAVVDSPRPDLRKVGVSVGVAVLVGLWLFNLAGIDSYGVGLIVSVLLCSGAACAWITVRRERGLAFAAVPLAALLGALSIRGVEIQVGSNDGWMAPMWAVVPVALTAWLAWGIVRMNRPPSNVTQTAWSPHRGVPPMQGQPLPSAAYPGQAYPQGAVPYSGNVGRQNIAAIIALVLSLLMMSLPAVVLGHIGRGQIRRTGESGWQMATAGLIIGYIGIVIYFIAGLAIGLSGG